jgi:hypothetical protein
VERGTHFVKGKQESLKVLQLIGDQEDGIPVSVAAGNSGE